LEDTHFSENDRSKNEQFANAGSDDRFLRHWLRNHDEWVLEGQTVKQKFYFEDLTNLPEGVRNKQPEFWKNNSWIVHEDNAPANNALAVKQFLADKCILGLEPRPYSPDLVPRDFNLFPK
jgi:hypothetical protein